LEKSGSVYATVYSPTLIAPALKGSPSLACFTAPSTFITTLNTMSEDPKMKVGEDLDQTPSMVGEIRNHPAVAHDDVFGEISEGGPNYRDVRCHPEETMKMSANAFCLVGRMARNRGLDDEEPDRPRSPVNPICL
jgi:hypothetical protein